MNDALLENYLPENALPYVEEWLKVLPCNIIVAKERITKLGDFKSRGDKAISISVNFIENKDFFFFILTHEIAHLHVFNQYKNRVLPHGVEWKLAYQKLLLASYEVYEKSFQPLVLEFAKNPKASFSSSPSIVRYFREEDLEGDLCFLEDLRINQFFLFQNKSFEVIERKNKRFVCKNLKNKNVYIFSPLAKVKLIP